MKAIIAVIMMASILILAMPVEGIRISSIDDAYIGGEVTITGVVVTVSSNVETCNVHTYEPGDTSILTIDDGSGTIRVCNDMGSFWTGERLMVSGIYAGGGIIYADKLRSYVEHGYKDISVAELKGFSEYYYDHSVRVKGEVKRIELTQGKTKLRIDDGTGTIDVEYGSEIEDIKINEEVVVEGKFYRNRIYAVAVEPKYKKAAQPSPEQSEAPSSPEPAPETPTPTPAPTLTPTPIATPTPTPVSAANTWLSPPLYRFLIFASVIVIIIVILISFKKKRFEVKWEFPKTIFKRTAEKAICYWRNKKNKNRNITSVSIVVFAVFSLMVVLSGVANAGVSPDDGRYIGDTANGTVAIIGETNLRFVTATGVSISSGTIEATWEGGPIIPFEGPFDSRYAQQYEGLVAGRKYTVKSEDSTLSTNITFSSPTLTIKKIIVRGKEYTKVVKGENITFNASTNLDYINSSTNITYKLVNPRGVPILIENVLLVNGANTTTINTAQLDTGEYKISIKSDPDTNNGLETEGSSKSFSVEKRSITIKPDVKKQAVNKDIIFDISTTYGFTDFSLNVTRGADTNVEFAEFIFEQDAIKRQSLGHSISEKTDEDGNYKAIAYFTEPGVYEITAIDTDAPDANIKATETVEIEEFLATVSVEKTEYYTGEHINISGSANAGDTITVKVVDGEEIETDVPIEDEEFSCTWRTAGSQPGSYEIGIWVLPFSTPDSAPPDASVTVFLMRGGLSATVNTEVVALGDEFEIEGFASGRDRVDILTIGPKGGSGDGFAPTSSISSTPCLTHSICSVLPEGDFKEKIRVDDNADPGTYLIAVLSYGRDGVWGTSDSGNLIEVLSNYSGSLAVKTQEQIIAILKDRTINAAGSDDLLCINTIKVENPRIELDDIEDVLLGGSIVVSGFTNREEDSTIIISVEGPVELKPKFAFVEKDGTFNLSFSTVSARTGEYTVTADDGKGYLDTKTVNVITAATPLLSVENSSGNSSSRSSAPTTSASSQSQDVVNEDAASADSTLLSMMQAGAKKQAGFEAIFAVIGLAIMVWLGLKRRRRG